MIKWSTKDVFRWINILEEGENESVGENNKKIEREHGISLNAKHCIPFVGLETRKSTLLSNHVIDCARVISFVYF